MMYLISQLWIWLLLALVVGLVVGWMTCSSEPTKWWGGWVPVGTAIFLIGLLLAVLRAVPDRMGFLLDSALLMFGSYILGCCISCLFKQWRERAQGHGHATALAGAGAAGLAGAGHSAAKASGQGAHAQGSAGAPAVARSAEPTGGSAAGSAGNAGASAPLKASEAGKTAESGKTAEAVASTADHAGSKADAAGTAGTAGGGNASGQAAGAANATSGSDEAGSASTKSKGKAKSDAGAAVAESDDLPPQPDVVVPEGLTGRRPRGYATPLNGKPDNLKLIRGIGRQNEGRLHALGIWHFDQIAKWVREEIDWVGGFLAFPGRIDREEWVKQAKILAKGGDTKFAKRARRGRVSTSIDSGDAGQSNVADLSEMTNASKKKPS